MLQTGQILGAYRLGKLLGRGGMGTVHAGTRLGDGQPVAIKALHGGLLVGPERDTMIGRFRQEAEIGLQLRHPGIVQVLEHGEQDDLLYLIMERIEGRELRALLGEGRSQPLTRALDIILQLLNALGYAHGHGVIHRDLKPANIMLREDQSLVIMDFGIARMADLDLTHTGELLGSPAYMAPEQLRGARVDQRVDLFAAGLLLYQLLTGRRAFLADSLAALMLQLLQEEPPPPSSLNPDLPASLDGILRQALAKEPAQRFASAQTFAAALRPLQPTPSDRATLPIATPPVDAEEADQPTEHLPPPEMLLTRIADLVARCIDQHTTGADLQTLDTWLDAWITLRERSHPGETTARETAQWHSLLEGRLVPALEARIRQQAPLPGKTLPRGRGDWLELVSLFGLLRQTADPRNIPPALEAARSRIVATLGQGVFDYSGELGRQLFSEDSPTLARITPDFMRMELLELALQELGGEAEQQQFRQTLGLFANQVIGKINTVFRQALDSENPRIRADVGRLLMEAEDLMVLVECLLTWGIDPTGAAPGGAVMTGFIDNIRQVQRLLIGELVAQFETEEREAHRLGPRAFEAGQAQFIERLEQLGMLYRLAVRLQSMAPVTPLHQLGVDVHHDLANIGTILLTILETLVDPRQPLLGELLWQRLSVIAGLAEQFGWLELHQKLLLAVRDRVWAG